MAALTREQMRGKPAASEPSPDAEADTVVDGQVAEAVAEDDEPEDDGTSIPEGFIEGPHESWIYKLRFPLRPTADDPDGADTQKIRLPKHVYVDDLMKAAAKNPKTGFEEIVYTLAAVTGVGDAIFKRLSEFDFRAISNAYQLRRRRAAAHPT